MHATRQPMLRRWPAAVLMLLLGALLVLAPQLAPRAYAASGDSISDFDISYTVNTDGSVNATETITYNFAGSGRHGIFRQLVTREPYGTEDQDAVYGYSDISVSSPTGASTQLARSTLGKGTRNEKLQLQIGSKDQTVKATETYVINYRVTGAMRTSGSYDEFYWDATGFDSEAPIQNATVKVEVPGGAQDVQCFAGPPGRSSTAGCSSKTVSNGVAEFGQSNLPTGSGLTVGVKLTPGLVANPNPTLVPNAEQAAKQEQTRRAIIGAGAAGLSAVVAPLLGWLYWRRRGRDERFVGVPPGTIPPAGAEAAVAPQQGKVNIPVAFSPPRDVPVGEAGMLQDGVVDIADTTATLIDLATRGVLTLAPQDAGGQQYTATLADPSLARAPHEVALLNELFAGRPPGAVASLGDRGTLTDAHEATSRELRNQVQARGWFTHMPRSIRVGKARPGRGLFGLIVIAWIVMGNTVLWSLIGGIWPLLLALVPIIITMVVVRQKLARGQRTAVGRAVTDQVEGFRTYLATAEADQLRFEEGEDIFSKYLPWAIIFGLTERWAKLCGELVAAGRIPNASPTWYYGDWTTFNILALNSTLSTAATPMPVASSDSGWSSGSGFGGGSSFGGGGFSGGGGGGGGVGSW